MCQLLKEAVFVGIAFVLLSRIITAVTRGNPTLSDPTVHLFLVGFLGHLLFEYTGINKYYCVHGNAC